MSGVNISRAEARNIARLLDDGGPDANIHEADFYTERLRDLAGPDEPTAPGTVVLAEGIPWVRLDSQWQAVRAIRAAYSWDDFLDEYQNRAGGVEIVDPE